VPASPFAPLGFCPPANVSSELVVADTIATAANVNIARIIFVLIITPVRAEIFISDSYEKNVAKLQAVSFTNHKA